MAATKQAKRCKNASKAKKSNSTFLAIGVGIIVLGLLAFGTYQVLGGSKLSSSSAASAASSQGVDTNQEPVANRETQYLGAPSDPAKVSLAEAGQLGQPTLVWFHADW